MLICKWFCGCGWEGETKDLETNDEGQKVCPNCHGRKELE